MPASDRQISILITGDFSVEGRIPKCLEARESADALFADVRPLVESVDFAIANLETTVTQSSSRIAKTGPNLRCTNPDAVGVLKRTGFKAVTTANNHMMDYGDRGVADTLKTCDDFGILHFGAGLTAAEARKPLLQTIGGKRFAFINACENEWSTTFGDYPGCNPLDHINLYEDITSLKADNDYVVVILHGGHELYDLPSPRMKKLYRWLIDLGADAVICHHTHCYCGRESYKGKPIVYSLGNFNFDNPSFRNNDKWNIGALAELRFAADGSIDVKMHPIRQNDAQPGAILLKGEEAAAWHALDRAKTARIQDDALLAAEFEKFSEIQGNSFVSCLEPIKNKYVSFARNRGFLPKLFRRSQRLMLTNMLRCEAHRDATLKYLQLHRYPDSEK